jgi:two-component system sensor histidine kinase KdpD
VLGAHLLVEHGDDLVRVTREVALDRGTTYVLIGAPPPRGAIRRLMTPALTSRLIDALPGIDVRIVADRRLRGAERR